MRRVASLSLVLAAAAAPFGCGDDPSGAGGSTGSGGASASSSSGTSSSTSSSATAGAGGAADGGGGAGGAPGSGGGAGSGGAPIFTADCTGDWTTPAESVLTLVEGTPQSIAISRGELELHFALRREGILRAIAVRSVRARIDDPFPPPVLAHDLDELCDANHEPYLDVSEDGLRAYVTCSATDDDEDACPPAGCEILLASRPNPTQSFERVGVVGRAGFHPSLRADELMIVTNGLSEVEGARPRVAERDALTEDFGPALEIDVPNDGIPNVTGATVSTDGLELYSYAKAAPSELGLARAIRARPTDPFGPFAPIGVWTSTVEATGGPDMTPDCRTLYVVRQAATGDGVDVLRR